MKTAIVCTLAFVALVNGLDGIHGQENRRASIRNESPYKRLLRTRSIGNLQVCKPLDTKMDDCNSCHCAADGSGWACTKMMCVPETMVIETYMYALSNPDRDVSQPGQNNPLTRDRRETPYSCEPDSHFMEDCNYCTCTPDGRAAMCTEMACPPKDGSTRRPLA